MKKIIVIIVINGTLNDCKEELSGAQLGLKIKKSLKKVP